MNIDYYENSFLAKRGGIFDGDFNYKISYLNNCVCFYELQKKVLLYQNLLVNFDKSYSLLLLLYIYFMPFLINKVIFYSYA